MMSGAFSRLFYAQAHRVEADRQARIRVPADLAKLARIRNEIVVVGVRDHIEVWDQAIWEAYLETKLPRYDEIAESAFRVEPPSGATVPAEMTVIPTRPK